MSSDASASMAGPDSQGAGLAALLGRLRQAPPTFYRSRLGEADHLDALPLTRRAELVRDQLAHLPFGTRRFADAEPPVRLGVAGTGAELLVLPWSAADLARERRAGCRLLGRLGVAAGMRVANTLPGALATPGALLLGDVIEDLGGLDVPLGCVDDEAAAQRAWEIVDLVEPAVIVLDQGSAAHLATTMPAAARDWWQGIVWLRTAGESGTSPRPPGFTGWERSWLAVPEVTSFVAGTCRAARFHLDDGVVAEVVEARSGAVCPAGRQGILALTALTGDTALVRYASDVRARVVPGACACGASGASIDLC